MKQQLIAILIGFMATSQLVLSCVLAPLKGKVGRNGRDTVIRLANRRLQVLKAGSEGPRPKPTPRGAVQFGIAAFAIIGATSSKSAHTYDMPYDPYPWCAIYSGDGGGGTNCGFLTLEQCRATVSGIGGFGGVKSILHSQPVGLASTQAVGAIHVHVRSR